MKNTEIRRKPHRPVAPVRPPKGAASGNCSVKLGEDVRKLSAHEGTAPFAGTAPEGHLGINAADAGFAFGAVHRFDVPAGRFAFKKRAAMLDKLFAHPIGRKFLIKLYHALCKIGFFFLGLAGDLHQVLYLVVEQRNALSKHFGTLDSGKRAGGQFDLFKK